MRTSKRILAGLSLLPLAVGACPLELRVVGGDVVIAQRWFFTGFPVAGDKVLWLDPYSNSARFDTGVVTASPGTCGLGSGQVELSVQSEGGVSGGLVVPVGLVRGRLLAALPLLR